MAVGETRNQVMIFDGFCNGMFVEVSTQVAIEADWGPMVYTQTYDAIGRLCNSEEGKIGAVITTLGIQDQLFPTLKWQFPATPLIKLAHDLGKPVAVISDHPNAFEHTVRHSLDTVISLRRNTSVTALAEWLGRLTAQI